MFHKPSLGLASHFRLGICFELIWEQFTLQYVWLNVSSPGTMRQMLFQRKLTLISLRYLRCQQELRAGCATLCKCDLHINVKVAYVGRCLDSSALSKKSRSLLQAKTRPFSKRCCGENGVALAGGLLWFRNAASVAAAVALLWWGIADLHHSTLGRGT